MNDWVKRKSGPESPPTRAAAANNQIWDELKGRPSSRQFGTPVGIVDRVARTGPQAPTSIQPRERGDQDLAAFGEDETLELTSTTPSGAFLGNQPAEPIVVRQSSQHSQSDEDEESTGIDDDDEEDDEDDESDDDENGPNVEQEDDDVQDERNGPGKRPLVSQTDAALRLPSAGSMLAGRRIMGDSYPSESSGQPSLLGEVDIGSKTLRNQAYHPYALQTSGPRMNSAMQYDESRQVVSQFSRHNNHHDQDQTYRPMRDHFEATSTHMQHRPRKTNEHQRVQRESKTKHNQREVTISDARTRGGPIQSHANDPDNVPSQQIQRRPPHSQRSMVSPNQMGEVPTQFAIPQSTDEIPYQFYSRTSTSQNLTHDNDRAQAAHNDFQPSKPPPMVNQPMRDKRNERPYKSARLDEDKDDHALQLDYDLPELYSKDFTDLQNENFDLRSRPKPAPTETTELTLASKLQSAMADTNEERTSLFDTLTLDEWEDAGDWFVSRFGDVMQRFKEARHQKRQTTRDFEAEVEARHRLIGRQRHAVDQALAEMKMNGLAVLNGTPGRVAQRPS